MVYKTGLFTGQRESVPQILNGTGMGKSPNYYKQYFGIVQTTTTDYVFFYVLKTKN